MAANFNSVTLAGNLTRDPELKTLQNDQSVCNFSLAINRQWKDKQGEKQEETTFVSIDTWGRTAENCAQYLTKGSSVLVNGRLKLHQWEDKDGNRRSKLSVVADVVQFLSKQERQDQPEPGDPNAAGAYDELDSPPF